jgi:hypothetical protein
MPRVVPAATLSDLQAANVARAELLSLDTTPVTRWCKTWSGRRRLIVDGYTYLPRNFSVNAVVPGDPARAGGTFVVDNRDKAVSNIFKAGVDPYALTLTYTVLVKRHWEDDWQEAYVPLVAAVCDASGILAGWTLVVGVSRGLHRRAWLREGERYCQHRYKGVWCQYVGIEVACPRTREACIGRDSGSNYSHFGGFDDALDAGAVIQMYGGGASTVSGDPYGGAYHPGRDDDGDDDSGGGGTSRRRAWRDGPAPVVDGPPPAGGGHQQSGGMQES